MRKQGSEIASRLYPVKYNVETQSDENKEKRIAYTMGYDKGWADRGNANEKDDGKLVPDENYFKELAKKLRVLWPAGEKDGKYPWRDSVDNITKRLQNLWTIRELDAYPIETCVSVAQRYLARFEQNAKYMKILKYYILKQGSITRIDGKIMHTNESLFADMLEGKAEEDAVENEIDRMLSETENDIFGGHIV